MFSLWSFIRGIDQFGYNVTLTASKHETHYTTFVGGFLSLIAFLWLFMYSLTLTLEMFGRDNNTITYSDFASFEWIKENEKFKLEELGFMLVF